MDESPSLTLPSAIPFKTAITGECSTALALPSQADLVIPLPRDSVFPSVGRHSLTLIR